MKKIVGGAIVLISAALLGAGASSQSFPNLKQIVIVYKTHFDIGYSALARDVVHRYRTEMIDKTLDAIADNRTRPKDQQFVWTIPGWPMAQMLGQGQDPARRAGIERGIREGNLVVHAMPFTTHTETLELEDLVRGLGYSSRIARAYGLERPRAAKMTDVPAHSWILPTLLKHAGVEFFHMGGNPSNAAPQVPLLFWWEGPDGSRLLTMYTKGYGSERLPPADWAHPVWLYINQTGDNEGPPAPDTVEKDVQFFREQAPGAKVKIGQLSDFVDALLAGNPDLPVVRGDMPDTWIHGPMSSPGAVKLSRRTRPEIAQTETLNTLEKCWGEAVPDISGEIERAYEKSLLFGEHTWGLAAQHYRKFPYGKGWQDMLASGLPPQLRLLEEAWDEHDDYIRAAKTLITGPLSDGLDTLADSLAVEGDRLVVFNPLPWKRSGIVTANVSYWPKFSALKAVDGGEPVAVVFEGMGEGDRASVIRFLAKDIPSLGYRTYVPAGGDVGPLSAAAAPKAGLSGAVSADETTGSIESPYFKASLDRLRGRITSLIDKRTGRELVDRAAPQGFGQYLYERFGKAEVMRYLNAYVIPSWLKTHGPIFDKMDVPEGSVYESALPKNMTLAVERSSLEVSAVMTGAIPGPGAPQSVSLRLTLYADAPAADLEIGLEKKPDGWPEAGWICLPFKIDAPSFRLGRLGSIIDPATEIIAGSNFRHLWTNTGAATFNAAGGVGICPIDSPLVSLGEPGSRKYDVRYIPANSRIYVNLYNNQWATNFREWWGGRLTSRVRIWTFGKYEAGASIFTPAMEARVPLSVARSQARAGRLPAAQSGLTLSRGGVSITAFGPNPDGEGTILRLWEQIGRAGDCEIRLPRGAGFSLAQAVDLRGASLGAPQKVENESVTIPMKPFAPVSLILK